jgi:asparagine synthase (glutamine-hydrolysing)
MAGRLPDDVRLNRRRGLQAADLVLRLRAERDAVEACLDRLEHSPAAGYVSLPALRGAWATALSQDSPQALIDAVSVLTRGLMAGLFIVGNAAWSAGSAARVAEPRPALSPQAA